MYQWLLVRTYLLSKVMPLLAALAVLLCTTMVLVVWSVMGGFLDMLVKSGRTTTGDVIVAWPNVGFAHYDELVRDLEQDPMVAGAAPVIETYALLQLPNGRTEMVFLRGVDGPSYAKVTSFADILWWRPLDEALPKDDLREDPRLDPTLRPALERYLSNGLMLERSQPGGTPVPAVVPGIEVSGFNVRSTAGFYSPRVYVVREPDGTTRDVDEFMPSTGEVVLSVLPLDREGRVLEQATRRLPVANEFMSGVYEADSKIVLVRLDVAQDMLRMDEAQRLVEGDSIPASGAGAGGASGTGTGTNAGEAEESFAGGPTGELVRDPARVTHVLVRGTEDLSELGAAEVLRERVWQIYREFASRHPDAPSATDISVLTWEDQQRTLISAVQKETGLVLMLFSIISLTAVFLVLAIFWSMVAEKTKDIGILRALGASRAGVAGVWIGYGLAIGVVGSLLGGGLAAVIVTNINPIHTWLGEALGLVVWDPRVYYFTEIPSKMDPQKIWIVLTGGVLSSALGAAVPAIRAAMMDPVRAIRFE